MTILEVLADFTSRLDSAGVDYVIGGSMASSIWGQMRQTNEFDLLVNIRSQSKN